MKKSSVDNSQHQIVLYQVDDSNVCVSVIFKAETFWLSQRAMAELFDCTTDNISLHLKNIYKEEELDEAATSEFFSVVQKEGKRDVSRNTKCYSLDAIIAVGYRVNSKKATRFRQWATKTLKEYITKGFVLNDDMLKNGRPFGKDYFDELLERIREIRASERRAYQKITDTFLKNNRRKVLEGKGYISHEQAIEKANREYEIFRVCQDEEYMSEFDKQTEKYFKGE